MVAMLAAGVLIVCLLAFLVSGNDTSATSHGQVTAVVASTKIATYRDRVTTVEESTEMQPDRMIMISYIRSIVARAIAAAESII
jgi:hypothetical protein